MNFWQIIGLVILIIVGLFLWRLAMEPVEDKILEIRSKARKEDTKVKPWIAYMAQNRFWFVVAMALAPLLIASYGVFLIVAVIALEIWEYINEDSRALMKRLRRR